MGHREDLLEGAKTCLLEKGWVGTTARDIVAASGANLASIGYHYGSKDALMMEAFLKMTEEWGEQATRRLAAARDQDAGRERQLARVMDAMFEEFAANRPFWVAQMEVIGQLHRNPELKERFAAVLPSGREGVLAIFEGVDDVEVPTGATRTAGAFVHALFIGMWAQWIMDPTSAPTGAELVEGMRRVLTGTVFDAPGK
ncbi:TetR/AcrR family transcriptional regulator [Streptomyces stramineus]|uniref:TetR/AcrR family transcriptional regulator n=1 Tax=Streptomyces stramineus TaxID=173861 RepID=A0ABP3K7R2_9ACTN